VTDSQIVSPPAAAGLTVHGPMGPGYDEILTPDALAFVAELARAAEPRRAELLERRREVQRRLDEGWRPDFLAETAEVRAGDWRVAPLPADLRDRRVEITGPVDRKMIINALNSGASVFMADFEDATSPTWANVVEGQLNLRDAVAGTISFTNEQGKRYALAERTAVLFVRPRGWHLDEAHVRLDGRPIGGGILDFGLYLFHNARALVERGTGPYFYLPKLEHHLEARLWNDLFVLAQERLGLPRGTIRATVLVETIMAAFQMDEILWELREHSAGLNCGRWDYIFSVIKKFRAHASFVMPDRGTVTMDKHFLRSYSRLAVRTCHRRGVHAMGGMSAFIPVKNDEAANERALAKVRADKEREVRDGHDGTWVAHPALVAVAREVFDAHMPSPNQIDRAPEAAEIGAGDLLRVPEGEITEAGVRQNITVGIRYLEAWLGGQGAVPIFNLMEDAATCEISRSQLWQWIRHGAALADGRKLTVELYRRWQIEELESIRREVGDQRYFAGYYEPAAAILDRLITDASFTDFLTLPAYEELLAHERARG
jgi:malate synthase A